ncbi:MAG: adenylate/guanylate cyclase domain-containing protein [Synechococcales bacterium]|nr:adenylate/guanylate cyclase domain-containing protein [Synechococcales bacterium]
MKPALQLQVQQDGETVTLPDDRELFTIGRLPDCDWNLLYGGISRCHARLIRREDSSWWIEDLGSRNGTRLNTAMLAPHDPQPLCPGDVIWLGDVGVKVLGEAVGTEQPDPKEVVEAKAMPAESDPAQAAGSARPPLSVVLRNVQELRQRWITPENDRDQVAQANANDRLQDLVEIAKTLSAAASIEAIFSRVQEVIFRRLPSVDRVALLVDVDESGQLALLNAAARDLGQPLPQGGDWISRTICQQVFTEAVAIQTADAQQDQRFAGQKSILLKNIRSAIAVPLWDDQRVVGVLYADANFSSHNWEAAGEADLSFFSTLANLLAANVQRWLLTQRLKNEETLRQRLERYHSPAVVNQLMSAGNLSQGRLTPIDREISILFADIVGFTALSERLSPRQVADLLNHLFEEMLQEIFLLGGTLDKYIGDCIMAFFGAPDVQPDHADRAFTAAMGMLNRVERLNAFNRLGEQIRLRISINSGKAVIGDVGSSQRVDYTALGATINLASRMEGICRPGECVMSEVTYQQLNQDKRGLIAIGSHQFKGIERPVLVYETQRSGQRHNP